MQEGIPRGERKVSVYLSDAEFDEIRRQAERLDRSISWVLQRAWLIARAPLQQIPGTLEDVEREPPTPSKAVAAGGRWGK